MFLHSEGRKHVCVHKAQMITEEILSPSVAVGWYKPLSWITQNQDG